MKAPMNFHRTPRRSALFLDAAVVAVGAGEVGVEVAAGVLEFLALGVEHFHAGGLALGEDRVAGVAITRAHGLAERRLVLVVVATEAAGPVLVADGIGIDPPVGDALGEDGDGVKALHLGDRGGKIGGPVVFTRKKFGRFFGTG